jgi:formylglycine-generating enzyme
MDGLTIQSARRFACQFENGNRIMKPWILSSVITGVLLSTLPAWASAQESRFFRIAGPVPVTITDVAVNGTVTWTNLATNATFTVQATTVLAGESSWVDWVQVPVSNAMTVHRLFDPNPPPGMVLIPAGSFVMGATTNMGHEFGSDEVPQHTVYVSAFYMDRHEVTKALWDDVKAWNGGNGYSYDNAGGGKAANHPVHTVSWYDAVKWCNARSQMDGLEPCYYTDAGLTVVYKTGQTNLDSAWVKWSANGYRLPTEAEWEKAARGGASGQRFPWADSDTIQHSRANYYSSSGYSYDTSPTSGYHPTFNDGVRPYTSPAGYFAPNGYGLYDMAGNVFEWCWDWWSSTYYGSSPSGDPRGPDSGSLRVGRGGSWGNNAFFCRTADRGNYAPTGRDGYFGFRAVRSAGQ